VCPQHLVEERGRNAKLIDSLDEITARLSEEDGALGAELYRCRRISLKEILISVD
jgi:hypothetical protein